jgi:hypothetical protein
MPPVTNLARHAITYLSASIRQRWLAIRSGELDRGALSVEWIFIAVLAAILAGAVSVLLTTAVNNESKKIP